MPVHRDENGVIWTSAPRPRQNLLVAIIVAVGINMVALIVVDGLFDDVSIGRWWPLIIGAAALGFANAVLKPVLALLTLPLIIVTFGLAYFFLNMLMLAFAEWVAPDFSITGFWTYVGATIVIWFVNVVVQALIGAVSGDQSPVRRR